MKNTFISTFVREGNITDWMFNRFGQFLIPSISRSSGNVRIELDPRDRRYRTQIYKNVLFQEKFIFMVRAVLRKRLVPKFFNKMYMILGLAHGMKTNRNNLISCVTILSAQIVLNVRRFRVKRKKFSSQTWELIICLNSTIFNVCRHNVLTYSQLVQIIKDVIQLC